MKKTLEYIYIISKLSTSLILFFCILVLGYFFYISFQNQEKAENDQIDLINTLNNNGEKLNELSKKINNTDTLLNDIKKSDQVQNTNDISKEIVLLNKRFKELNLKFENLSKLLTETQSKLPNDQKINQEDKTPSLFLDKNKMELSKLILLKFENNIEFSYELDILQSLNQESKQHIFEKIDLVKLKNFRGNSFLKKIFNQEVDLYLKENFNKSQNDFLLKSLRKFIAIQPSKKNIIKNKDINILSEIEEFLDQKKYNSFHKKITTINNYKDYFLETINQIEIAIEFEELINQVS